MTDKPICPRCARPIHDTAYVDSACEAELRRGLERVALVAGEATTTIAKLDRIESTGVKGKLEPEPVYVDTRPGLAWLRSSEHVSALNPSPLPLDLNAANAHDAAVNTVITWARLVSEERGKAIPDEGHPLAAVATWLSTQLDWLRHHPDAETAFDELTQACRTLERVVDRPPSRIVVGQCPCGEFLYATKDKADVKCQGCGTTYDVEATREQLRKQLGESIFTAAEIATLAAYLGIGGSRESMRKLINKWHERGHLIEHSYRGEAAFRFGEVIARLAASTS